jgi:hypothetical protein
MAVSGKKLRLCRIWEIDIPQLKRKIGNQEINLASFITEVNKDYDKLSGGSIIVSLL